MLGFNGGLIGAQRSTNVGSAPGIWTPNEQIVAQRVEAWPTIAGIPVPALWYDFSDANTVTVASSQITQITSKGTKAWTLTKSATGPGYTTGINGLNCCDWGSVNHSNYLRNSNAETLAIGELYVVVDSSFGGTFPARATLISAVAAAWSFMGSPGSTTFINSGTTFDDVFINGGATDRFSNVFTSPSIDGPAIMRVVSNTSATFNATDGFQIGGEKSTANRGWLGLAGEYLVYSAPLSVVNRGLVMNYLANKWGITLV